jgi:hypothetical protein
MSSAPTRKWIADVDAENKRLLAENKRLRDALAVYADHSHWGPNEYEECDDPTRDQWRGDGDGFDVAEQALKPKD